MNSHEIQSSFAIYCVHIIIVGIILETDDPIVFYQETKPCRFVVQFLITKVDISPRTFVR